MAKLEMVFEEFGARATEEQVMLSILIPSGEPQIWPKTNISTTFHSFFQPEEIASFRRVALRLAPKNQELSTGKADMTKESQRLTALKIA